MVTGDGAGFVNMEKIKGIHYAIRSGMAAADTALEALGADGAVGPLDGYRERLESSGMLCRSCAMPGTTARCSSTACSSEHRSRWSSEFPRRLGIHRDGEATKKGARLDRPDPGRMDGATFVGLTGTLHREDEPSHMSILDPQQCVACERDYANACTHFCPGQVYRWNGSRDRAQPLELPPLHELHGEVPGRRHPLDPARGRRGTALQAALKELPGHSSGVRATVFPCAGGARAPSPILTMDRSAIDAAGDRMPRKTILVIGTLDTKGVEFAYIGDLIAARGHATLVMDAGVTEPAWAPDIDAARVAEAGGGNLDELRAAHDRANALEVMCRGARAVALELVAEGRIDGVIGLGGSGGTAIATSAMRALPVGLPKLMVSTMASGDVSPIRRREGHHDDVLGRRRRRAQPDLARGSSPTRQAPCAAWSSRPSPPCRTARCSPRRCSASPRRA